MNRAKSYFFQTLTVSFLLLVAYLLAFWISIGSYAKSEWWIEDIDQYKDYIASSIDEPKIIIAAGSNALYGINSGIIEEVTGYRVANLAVHAALDIDFLYYKLVKHLREGDIVVMPIEFGMYSRGYDSEWFTNNMVSWGYDDYLKKLPVRDVLYFGLYTPKSRIYLGFVSKITQNFHNLHKNISSLSQAEVVENLNRILESKDAGRFPVYDYKNLTRYGEFSADAGPTEELLKIHEDGIAYVPDSVSDHFVSVFEKIGQLLKDRKAKLILTWPMTARNKLFDLSTEAHQIEASRFKQLLSDKSIDIYCNPALFSLDIRYFFNTVYHANKRGALIRSKTLGHCINSVLADKNNHDTGFEKSIEMVDQLQAGIE